jgi:hypothetical protein
MPNLAAVAAEVHPPHQQLRLAEARLMAVVAVVAVDATMLRPRLLRVKQAADRALTLLPAAALPELMAQHPLREAPARMVIPRWAASVEVEAERQLQLRQTAGLVALAALWAVVGGAEESA